MRKHDVMNIPHAHCSLVNPDCKKYSRESTACSRYTYAQFKAKPKAACEPHCLSLAVM